jgi:hypothetical protein
MPGAQLGESSAQPRRLAQLRMAIDQPAQFAQRAAGVLELSLVQLGQGEPDADIVTGTLRRLAPLQGQQLSHRRFRLLERTGKLARMLQQCRHPILSRGGEAKPRQGSSGKLSQRLEHQIDDSRQDAEQRPEHASEQQRLGSDTGQPEDQRDQRSAAEEKAQHAAQIAQRIGVERARAVALRFREDRHAPKLGLT